MAGGQYWWERLDALYEAQAQQGSLAYGDYGPVLDQSVAPWSVAQSQDSAPQGLWSGFALDKVTGALNFGAPLFEALATPYRMLSRNVLSPFWHVAPTAFDQGLQERIGVDNAFEALFDGRTWDEIMRISKKDSVGRGLVRTFGIASAVAANPFEADERGGVAVEAFKQGQERDDGLNTYLNVASGATDFVSVMFLDPLFLAGKAAKVSRVFKTTKLAAPVIQKTGDIDEILKQEPVTRFLAWTNGKSADHIMGHDLLKLNPERARIADLLERASPADKELILKQTFQSEDALAQLQVQAPHIAAEYQRLRGAVNSYQTRILPTIPGLDAEARAAALAPHREGLRRFGEENRTLLTLNQTEFNPRNLPNSPFTPRQMAQDEHRILNTYSTVYRPLANGQERSMFTLSGEIERTPLEIQAALDEFAEFREAARVGIPTPSLAPGGARLHPRTLVPVRDAPTLPAGTRRGRRAPVSSSPWSARIRGQQDLFGSHLTGEAQNARVTARGIRAQQAAGPAAGTGRITRAWAARQADDLSATTGRVEDLMQSRRTMKAAKNSPASVPTSYQAWWHQQMIDPDTQLLRYNPELTQQSADRMLGQLDLIDDWVVPELNELTSRGSWLTRTVEDAADAAIRSAPAGIYASQKYLPKGGMYARWAETKADMAHKVSMSYMRRNGGGVARLSWLARPAYVLGAISQAVGREAPPQMLKVGDPEAWHNVDTWLKRVKDLLPETRASWVRSFRGETTEQGKLARLEEIEASVIAHMLATHNVTDYDTIEHVIQATLGTRSALIARMTRDAAERSGANTPRGSTEGFTAVRPATLGPDGTAIVAGPQLVTQLLNGHPMLPLDDLDLAFKRDRTFLQGALDLKNKDTIMEWSSTATRIWKTSVLLRGGYGIRNSFDEVLLASAALGSFAYHAGFLTGIPKVMRNAPIHLQNKFPKVGREGKNKRLARQRRLPEIENAPLKYERGMDDVEVIPGVWARGFANDGTGVTKARIGSDQRALFNLNDDLLIALRNSSQWGVLNPKKKPLTHLNAWRHALLNQIGQDAVGRQFLRGKSYAEVLAWTNTKQGAAYMRRLTLANARREDWLKGVAQMVDQYTLGNAEIMAKSLDGSLSFDDLRAIPEDQRMPVHGGEIDFTLGKGEHYNMLDRAAAGFFKYMAKVPVDTLVRHPVADLLYQRRLRELIANAEAQGVKVAQRPDRLYHFESIARRDMVKEMDLMFKDQLFSSPQAGLRFISPFFGAHRASMARWARLIGEDPSIMARGNQLWQGLHKPFDVVDENGYPLERRREDEQGNIVNRWIKDPNGKVVENPAWATAKQVETDDDIYGFDTKNQIVMRLPKWAWKVVGATPLIPEGTEEWAPGREVPLKSFLTMIPGDQWYNAGFGPWVTAPLAWAVRDHPGAAKVAKDAGVLPFGPRDNWAQHVLPAYASKAMAGEEGFDNRAYNTLYYNILRTEVMRIQRGERPRVSDSQLAMEVKDKADGFSMLRAFESWLLPFSASPVYYSKDWEGATRPLYGPDGKRLKEPGEWDRPSKDYQFLAAILRDYKSQFGGELGEQVFLNEHPEAWLWLAPISQNNAKIPASSTAYGKAKSVQHLAHEATEIYDAAAGITNADYEEFDSLVYDAQMSNTWNPLTGQKYRSNRPPEEAVNYVVDAQTRMGWKKYSVMMDHLRNLMEERGIISLEQPGARDLKEKKREYVQFLADTNPSWGQAYLVIDPVRAQKVRDQAWIVANDERLLRDKTRTTELQSLQRYLSTRQWLVQELEKRDQYGGSRSLTAASNGDLLRKWDEYRNFLERNTRFSEIWMDRYFANDFLQEMG